MAKYLVGDIECGGFGAMYARRKLIMQIAEAFNRVPVFRYTNYAYEDPFEPLETVLEDLKKQGINEVKTFKFEDVKDEAVFFNFNTYWGTEFMNRYQCWCPKDKSYLLYTGEKYNKLKLTKDFQQEVENKIDAIKKDNNITKFDNVIGVHLRRGDKLQDNEYLSDDFVFSFIKEKFGTGVQIFITSDEGEYIQTLKDKYKDYNILYDRNESRYGDKNVSNVELVLKQPELKHSETLTFIKNVEILKQCKCVIGMYNAQMTKIAGSINSFLRDSDNLFLLNPKTNNLETLGSSIETS